MGMFTLLAACNGPEEAGRTRTDPGDDAPVAEGRFAGASANEGFGARVVVADGEVYAAAPFAGDGSLPAGRVGARSGASWEGEAGALFGAGLAALSDGTVLVGAPGVGRVTTIAGAVVAEEPGLGGVLTARGAAWAASTSVGALTSTGARFEWDRRPDALALDGAGRLWAGFARGEVAVRSSEGLVVTRARTGDEAGYALLVGDVDGNGVEELVVGAPGAGVVYVVALDAVPASLADAVGLGPGAGRFGAALVAGDGALFVGAPMAGPTAEGAVYAVRGGVATELWTGAAGDQLGTALAYGDGALVAGTPQGAEAPGYVRVGAP